MTDNKNVQTEIDWRKTIWAGLSYVFALVLVMGGFMYLGAKPAAPLEPLGLTPVTADNQDEIIEKTKDAFPQLFNSGSGANTVTSVHVVEDNPHLYELQTKGGELFYTDANLSFFARGDFYLANKKTNYALYRKHVNEMMADLRTPSASVGELRVQQASVAAPAVGLSTVDLQDASKDLEAIKQDLAKRIEELKNKTGAKPSVAQPIAKNAENTSHTQNGAVNTVSYSKDGAKLPETEIKSRRAKIVSNLKDELLLTYPAEGKQTKEIYVFTDYTCPYCKNLHKNLDKLTAKGITVNYLNFPRVLAADQSRPEVANAREIILSNMKSAWCSKDRKAAYDTLYETNSVEAQDCSNLTEELGSQRHSDPIRLHYNIGQILEINVTPAAITETGEILLGSKEILEYQ